MSQPQGQEISDAVDRAKREMVDELGFLLRYVDITAGKIAYPGMEWHAIYYPDGTVGYSTYHIEHLGKDYSIGNH